MNNKEQPGSWALSMEKRIIGKVSWSHLMIVLTSAIAWTSGLVGFGYHEFTTNKMAMAASINSSEKIIRSHGLSLAELRVIVKRLDKTMDEQSDIQRKILNAMKELIRQNEQVMRNK